MVIANPIYDRAFKLMMENERVAKFFIGTLLEETIESVEAKPQEYTYADELVGLALVRLDFVATIKTATGELKKILVEIQKAKNQVDIMRFRNYLAGQYKKEDIVNNQKQILPITTIYILAFKLPGIETACIKVERNYKDLVNKTIIEKKSDFVEKLTHDCFVVQARRITGRYQTRLDKLLSIFEQANFTGDGEIIKEFNHGTDVEEIKLITDILHHAGTDPAEKKKIEDEQEFWRTIEATYENERIEFEKVMEEKEKALLEKNKVIEDKEKVIEDKEKVIEDKEKVIEDKEKVIEDKEKVIQDRDKKLEEMAAQLAALKRKLEGL